MTSIPYEMGSSHAKIGYADYNQGSMQFLETRFNRYNGNLLPKEAETMILNSHEIPASIYRVIGTTGTKPRYSAPMLLRCRPNQLFNVDKYFGGIINRQNYIQRRK